MCDKRSQARALAQQFLAAGKPLDWFEALYAAAGGDESAIPWADMWPNPNLLAWLDREPVAARGRGLVVGCGLGDDAEELARRGWTVTAFDISPTAIDWCRRRFSRSKVNYVVADLLNPPSAWEGQFDFILESYTLQALPPQTRAIAIRRLPPLLAPGGTLLIICRGRGDDDPLGEIPWPLSPSELAPLMRESKLLQRSFEDFVEDVGTDTATRRFRVAYQRPAS
jgi:SAM-dependent methyltransferase